MSDTCSTCRFWELTWEPAGLAEAWKACTTAGSVTASSDVEVMRLHLSDSRLAALTEYDHFPEVWTRHDFGCVLHQPAEVTA